MKKYMNKFRIPSARLQSWDYSDNGAYFITICTQNRQHYFGKISKQRFIPNDTGILAEKYWSEIPIHFPFVELGNFVVMPNHVHGILIIDKNARVPSVETRFIASGDTRLIASVETPITASAETRLTRPVETRFIASGETRFITSGETRFIASGETRFIASGETRFITSVETPITASAETRLMGPVETRLIASLPSEINTPSNSHKTGGITGAKNPMHHENISRIIRWYKGRCSFEIRKIQPDFAWQSRFYDHIIRDPESFERIQTYIERNPLNWKKDRFSK